MEDARTFHMRPKVDMCEGDIRLIILRTTHYNDEAEDVEFGEISVFVAPDFVITVRQGVASGLRPAQQWLDLLATGPSAVLWAIIDHVVDGYAPLVAGLEDDIGQVEDTVFSENAAPAERAAGSAVQPYLRDVQNALSLVNEEVGGAAGLAEHGPGGEHGRALGRAGQDQQPAERHHGTARHPATIFLPLTFVTGFFGQNFGWLTGHIASFATFMIFGISGLVVPLALLLSWLRRRRAGTGQPHEHMA